LLFEVALLCPRFPCSAVKRFLATFAPPWNLLRHVVP
jgi:hypothetical protein